MNASELARFAQALRSPDVSVDGLVDVVDVRARRFDVHRNTVASALVEALRTAFPALRRLLGDEYFDAFAAAYADAHPPRSRLLLQYGDALPEFVAAFRPLDAWPYLADVARIERLRVRAFHARDEAPYSSARAQRAIAAADRVGALRLSSSTALLVSEHAAGDIWRSQIEERALPAMLARPQCVLVWRQGFGVATEVVDGRAGSFVAAIAAGAAPRDALDAMGEGALEFRFMLARLLRDGALVPGDRFFAHHLEIDS